MNFSGDASKQVAFFLSPKTGYFVFHSDSRDLLIFKKCLKISLLFGINKIYLFIGINKISIFKGKPGVIID